MRTATRPASSCTSQGVLEYSAAALMGTPEMLSRVGVLLLPLCLRAHWGAQDKSVPRSQKNSYSATQVSVFVDGKYWHA